MSLIRDYEVDEVTEGWLVLGARLESEARQAVLEDLVDRLGCDAHELGLEVLALSDAEAEPGYWEVLEIENEERVAGPLTDADEPEDSDFGFLLRVEDDADGEG